MEEQSGEDISCEKCQEMRDMGYPRPTCEECGFVELSAEDKYVFGLIDAYYEALVSQSGFDAWHLNIEAIKMLCEEYKIKPVASLVRRILILVRVVKQEKKEKNEELKKRKQAEGEATK